MICYAILNLFNGSRNNFFTITSSSQTSTINCRHQKGTEDSSRPPHPERGCKSLKHTSAMCWHRNFFENAPKTMGSQ